MSLGDTWRNRYGSRIGLYQRTVDGRQEPVRPRVAAWSRDGSPVLAPDLGETEWNLVTGKINTAEPTNSPKWAILVAKTAFRKAAAEAISQKPYFDTRYNKADDFYMGMWRQDHSIPAILAHAKGQIGHSAPNASRWLTERARRYAVKFEGYESPKASKAQVREGSGESEGGVSYATAPGASSLTASVDSAIGSTQAWFEKWGKPLFIAGGVAAISYPILAMAFGVGKSYKEDSK